MKILDVKSWLSFQANFDPISSTQLLICFYLNIIVDRKWFQGFHWNDPWRNCRSQILGQKRSKRDILPFLVKQNISFLE
jgi:hypothetical protein